MFLNRLFSSFATPSSLACYDRSPGQVELRRVLAGSAPESLPRRGRLGWKLLVCARIAGTEDMLVTHLAKVIWLPNSMFISSAVQMYDTLRLWVVRLFEGLNRGPGSKFLCMTL